MKRCYSDIISHEDGPGKNHSGFFSEKEKKEGRDRQTRQLRDPVPRKLFSETSISFGGAVRVPLPSGHFEQELVAAIAAPRAGLLLRIYKVCPICSPWNLANIAAIYGILTCLAFDRFEAVVTNVQYCRAVDSELGGRKGRGRGRHY